MLVEELNYAPAVWLAPAPSAQIIKLKKRKRPYKSKSCYSQPKPIHQRHIVPVAEHETSHAVSMWRSVVIQALYDLSGKGGSLERRVVRANSYAWFAETSSESGPSDFETVCDLAGIDKRRLLEVVKMIREEGLEITENTNIQLLKKEFGMRRNN